MPSKLLHFYFVYFSVPMVKYHSYSTFIASCYLDNGSSHKENRIAAFRLTPLGASAALCSPVNTWANILTTHNIDCAVLQNFSQNTILYHLYSNVLRGNSILHRSIEVLDWPGRQIARAAFQDGCAQGSTGKARTNYSPEAKKQQDGLYFHQWFHILCQALVLDRFIYAYLKSSDQDMRHTQLIHMAAKGIHQQLRPFYIKYIDWRFTILEFFHLWRNMDHMLEQCRLFAQDNSNSRTITHARRELQKLQSKMEKVEANFCFASYALIALTRVGFCLFSIITISDCPLSAARPSIMEKS